jgi:hypothetical protein
MDHMGPFTPNSSLSGTPIDIYMYIAVVSDRKRKMEARAIFLNLFTSCKEKLVICLYVYEETNGSYPFSNGLKGLNGLAHLC